jgi:hypothetical protein
VAELEFVALLILFNCHLLFKPYKKCLPCILNIIFQKQMARASKFHELDHTSTHELDHTDEELRLFSKVQTIEYYTFAITISGLDLPAGFYFPEGATDSTSMGHIVAFQRFFEDTNVYLIWSYGNAQCDQRRVTESMYDDIQRMGGACRILDSLS